MMSTANTGGLDPTLNKPIVAPGPEHVGPPEDAETVYYEGSPLMRGSLGEVFKYGAIGIILIAIPILIKTFHGSFPPFIVTAIMILAGLLFFIIPVIITKSTRYRITNYRIDYERGLLSRNIDTIELWHVEDLHFHQSLLGRIFDVGSITIVSRDETTPQLELHSLPKARPLYESLKQRVLAVKRQQGVLKVDPG